MRGPAIWGLQVRPFGFDRRRHPRILGALRPQMLQRFLLAGDFGADNPGRLGVHLGIVGAQQKLQQCVSLVGPRRVAGDGERIQRKRAALPGFDKTDRRRGAAQATARGRGLRFAGAPHAEAIAATGEGTHDIGDAEAVDRGLRAREHPSCGLDLEQRRLRRIDVH